MKLQKIASLVLAIIMILSLGITAFAEETPETGSITINGVSTEGVYAIYRLLDLESYNTTSGAYSYTVNADWAEFFTTAEALKYFNIDDAGYVTWKAAEDDNTVATFAKGALSYAQENEIAPVKSSENEGEFVITGTTGVFSGLELGYYLIDSNVGALCGLTTTNPNASINAKNAKPTMDKQVLEDSTNQWGDTNTADIGQTVYFRVTINVHEGAQNYILHDLMLDDFSFIKVSKVEKVIPQASGDPIVETAVEGEDYTVVTETENCTFEVVFNKEFCDGLDTNNKVVVYYEAMLTRNATIAGEGNPNEAWLSFGETLTTTHDFTTTYTYGIDIVKTDSQNTLIDGAVFRIYDAADGGNEVGVVLMEDGVTYRRAREDEVAEGKTVPIVVTDGQVRVVGFDNGEYYLEEKEAPDGYNKLTARQKFVISDKNLDATFNGDVFSTGSGVHVVNKTGSMLPETGGMGTTIFYVAGGLLVASAIVVLVSKKRMSSK